MAWEEAAELDSEDERVVSMHDGIKRILSKQREDDARVSGKKPDSRKQPDSRKHVLPCGRILKVDIERRLVVVTVEKLDGEKHQLRIEATQD